MCVYMCVSDCCPTGQFGGREPQVKTIHPDGAFTYPWLYVNVVRLHSLLFQNESCEFHKLNHIHSRGSSSGAIPR